MEGTRARQIAVRIIFDKYVHEGYGAQRIATYSNKLDCRAWSGKMWHHATIRGIICNLTYTGVLRSGENGIIDKLVRQIFERIKSIPKEEIVNARYREKMEERKGLLRTVKAEYAKAASELDMLKAEIIKSLRGESTFSKELLDSMVAGS